MPNNLKSELSSSTSEKISSKLLVNYSKPYWVFTSNSITDAIRLKSSVTQHMKYGWSNLKSLRYLYREAIEILSVYQIQTYINY